MKILVLIHVLSSIIGVGPTFFGHVLTRKNQSLADLRLSLQLGKKLEFFPKIGGSIAVLTGLLLFWLGDYGSFLQLWLLGSLILYVVIQIIVIGFITPLNIQLSQWVFAPENKDAESLPTEQKHLLMKVDRLFYIASTFGVLLFVFMILKPGA